MELWKAISGILASILVTGLAAWFTFGVNTATLTDVDKNEKKIELNVKSLNALQVTLSRIEAKLENVAEDVKEIKQESR